jgi:ribosome maturation factor RimP
MANETLVHTITGMINNIISNSPAIFLVEVKVKPTNNIKIFLDADDGLSIDKCVGFNRTLYRQIEEMGMFPDGDFSLEISSPGLDEPLKLPRQYAKNIGRQVEVSMLDGLKIEGRLVAATADGIELEETKGKNKKKEVLQHNLLFNNIKATRVQVVF